MGFIGVLFSLRVPPSLHDPYTHLLLPELALYKAFCFFIQHISLSTHKNVPQVKYARYSRLFIPLFNSHHIRQPPLHKLLESIQRKQQYIHPLKIPDSTAIGDLCFFVVILSGKVLSLPFTSTYRSSMSNSSCPFSSLSKEPLYAFR